jgi:hypothetical protein
MESLMLCGFYHNLREKETWHKEAALTPKHPCKVKKKKRQQRYWYDPRLGRRRHWLCMWLCHPECHLLPLQ